MSEPMTTEHLAMREAIAERDRALEAAAAREAALVEQGNYLRELVDAVTPEDEDELVGDGPLDGYSASDCLAAIDGWDAVVASPSAAAEGFRLMVRVECSALRAAGFLWAAGYIERLADAAGVRWRRENPQQEGSPDGS